MQISTAQRLADPRLRALHAEFGCPPPLERPAYDPDVLSSLGLVVVRFQRLEETLRGLLEGLNGDRASIGMTALLSEVRFKSLLVCIGAVLSRRSFSREDDLRHVLKLAGQAEETRNALVHSVWSTGPRLKEKAHITHGIQLQLESFTALELRSVAEWIASIDHVVAELHGAYLREHSSGSSQSPA